MRSVGAMVALHVTNAGVKLTVRMASRVAARNVNLDDAFPAATGNYLRWLLNTPLGQFRVNCIQVTEQTTGGLLGSSSEVYLCNWRFIWISTARADIGWAERPDSIDGKRLPTRILQQAVELSCRQVVGSDVAAGFCRPASCKLSHGQIVAEASKVKRSQSHAPGSV